jgi:SAM-dependent methyltransferase
VSDANSYYQQYYAAMGANAYLGEAAKHTSRMLVFQDWLRSYLKPGAKVLDIGCGDAIFAELMPEFEWYGVDINIQRANSRINDLTPNADGTFRLNEHDLMKPPYPWPEKHFDAVICSEVLEHVWDLRVVHREAKRLLKRDGVYVISTPNFDWITNHLEHFRRIMQTPEAHWSFEHIRHYGYDTHKRFLNDCGFIIEKHTGSDAHYCPIFAGACRAIRDGLRKQGVEVQEELLHKWVGEGVPHYQHTIHLACKKA